ncbi:MotE family protein [Thalassospira australica]|uniref:MotE family protein n=1 Tax=Thalassospira australica TaxID=1528106 RepID=UPI0038518250
MSSVRILPLVVLVGLVVLTVKIVGLFSDSPKGEDAAATSGVSVVQLARAQAQEQPAAAPDAATPETPAGEPGLDDPLGMMEDDGTGAVDGMPNGSGDTPPMLGGDPTLFTQEEIDLLQNLSVRRSELDRKEQRLDERESLLAAAEARIDAKIEEMKSLKTAIEGLVETKEEQENERITKLISVYEKMKPKDAARIWNDLDMDILLQVALGMREANTAAVLAEMTADRARALTTELAYKQDINMLPLQ